MPLTRLSRLFQSEIMLGISCAEVCTSLPVGNNREGNSPSTPPGAFLLRHSHVLEISRHPASLIENDLKVAFKCLIAKQPSTLLEKYNMDRRDSPTNRTKGLLLYDCSVQVKPSPSDRLMTSQIPNTIFLEFKIFVFPARTVEKKAMIPLTVREKSFIVPAYDICDV